MVPTTQAFDIRITGYGDDESGGKALVETFDRQARWFRAAGGLGASWAAALATAFIPVAHFVLVPVFTVFGIVVFVRRIGTEALVKQITGTCPDCGTTQVFEAAGRWTSPRELACRKCRRALKARTA